jgi:hypothetical protein
MLNKMTTTAPTPAVAHADIDLALRRIAAVLVDRTATVDQVMTALREWSRIVMDRRELVAVATMQNEGRAATSLTGIRDVVSLSAQALVRTGS